MYGGVFNVGGIESLMLGHISVIFGIFLVNTDHFTMLVDISLYYVGMSTQVGDLIINTRGTGLEASGHG